MATPRHILAPLLGSLLALGACAAEQDSFVDDIDLNDSNGEGLAFDEENPDHDFSPKFDTERQYEVPEWVLETELVAPEIRVSLDGLSVHLFDRETGLSRVYPTGVGMLGQWSGKSYTPTGFFATSPNVNNGWWNISERFAPDYFGGFPFLRINAHNSRGQNTYGFHGPITYECGDDSPGDGHCDLADRLWFLVQDYVSHGCMRMRQQDIVELFYLIQGHPSVPVTIQQEIEVDALGNPIQVDGEAIDWPNAYGPDEAIEYGELGPRPADWDVCEKPEDWPWRSYGC